MCLRTKGLVGGQVPILFTNFLIYAKLDSVRPGVQNIKKDLVKFAHKAAEDKLTFGSSGNISARKADRIYIKARGVSFEKARLTDFIGLDIKNPLLKNLKVKPSCEYRFHIVCYKKRPEIKAVIHLHPLAATTLYSSGIKLKPLTIESSLYIGKRITAINFAPPGTKRLADAISKAIVNNDVIIIKKHGLVAVGKSLQEAYLRALVVEREARAQFICRLFKKKPPFLTRKEIESIAAV